MGKFCSQLEPNVRGMLYVWTAPWQSLSCSVEHVLKSSTKGAQKKRLEAWKDAKKTEFTYVSFAGSLVASVVTSSLQWNSLEDAHWLIRASWYGSLIMSIFCIVIAFHLSIFITVYETNDNGKAHLLRMMHGRNAKKPRFLSLYILQMPIMLLSYATILYAIGLSLLVLQPLWSLSWSDENKIALVFAACLAFSCSSFITVLFAVYNIYIPKIHSQDNANQSELDPSHVA